MTRLLLGVLLGAIGFAILVRFVASGARRSDDWASGEPLPQPDPYLLGMAERARWN